MKQMILLFFAGLLISLSSCGGEESSPLAIEKPLTWEKAAILEAVSKSNDYGVVGDFIFSTDDETKISFYELSKNKYTLISIGRSISRACAEQSPKLQEAHDTKNNWCVLQFCTPVSENSTFDEEVDYVENFITENNYSFVHIVPNFKTNFSDFVSMFPTYSYVPANFILDKNHKIVKSFFFIAGWKDLEHIMSEIEDTY